MIEKLVIKMLSVSVEIVTGQASHGHPVDTMFKVGISSNFLDRVTQKGIPFNASEVGMQLLGATGIPSWNAGKNIKYGGFMPREMIQNQLGQGWTCTCVAVPVAMYKAFEHRGARTRAGWEASFGPLVEGILDTQSISTGKVSLIHEVPGITNGEDYATTGEQDPRGISLASFTTEAVAMNAEADTFHNAHRDMSKQEPVYQTARRAYDIKAKALRLWVS